MKVMQTTFPEIKTLIENKDYDGIKQLLAVMPVLQMKEFSFRMMSGAPLQPTLCIEFVMLFLQKGSRMRRPLKLQKFF